MEAEKYPSMNSLSYDTYLFGDVIKTYDEFQDLFLKASADFSRLAEQQGYHSFQFKSGEEVPLSLKTVYDAREAKFYDFIEFAGNNWRELDHYRLSKKLIQEEEMLRKMILAAKIVDRTSNNTISNPRVTEKMISRKNQEVININQKLEDLYNEILEQKNNLKAKR